MVAGRFWHLEERDVDLAGANAMINTWPLFDSLDPSAALRRMIANVWFEVRNPDADNETVLAAAGVMWALIIWPFLEGSPPPGSLIEPGPTVMGNRTIAWGAGPGERIEDTPLGVHRYRYPGGGQAFHVDVQSQRRPPDSGGNPWVPYISWDFKGAYAAFTDVTHARIRVQSTWLMDRP